VASLFLIRAALSVDVALPGSGFSVWFPVEPKATAHGRSPLWTATDQAYIFIVGHEDNAKATGSKSEFQASLKVFLAEVEGRVLSQKMLSAGLAADRSLRSCTPFGA
jgi:hypothetical protein